LLVNFLGKTGSLHGRRHDWPILEDRPNLAVGPQPPQEPELRLFSPLIEDFRSQLVLHLAESHLGRRLTLEDADQVKSAAFFENRTQLSDG
jgi:hypothetical protein